MIIPFEESEEFFDHAFQQGGLGMPRYRGSPMIGGSFWGRVVSFAKGLFSKAAPHISNLITQAQPHVKRVLKQLIQQLTVQLNILPARSRQLTQDQD